MLDVGGAVVVAFDGDVGFGVFEGTVVIKAVAMPYQAEEGARIVIVELDFGGGGFL